MLDLNRAAASTPPFGVLAHIGNYLNVSPMIPVAMLVVALRLPLDASAQKKRTARTRHTTWHVYRPPDRSFRIETPKRLRYAKHPEYKWLEFYGSRESESETCGESYAVLAGHFDATNRPDDPSGMFLLIGGSHIFPSSEVEIAVDGFKAKDFIYSRPFDSGCKYRRGWVIEPAHESFGSFTGALGWKA